MEKWISGINKRIIFVVVIALYGSSVYSQIDSLKENNIKILKRLIDEVYNNRNFEIISELVADDYIEYTNGVRTKSSQMVKETVMFLLKTAPDFKLSIMDMIADRDKVVLLWKYNGINEKYGKKVILEGIYIARFKDAKIIEGWLIFDNYSRFNQLGYTLLPPPDATEE